MKKHTETDNFNFLKVENGFEKVNHVTAEWAHKADEKFHLYMGEDLTIVESPFSLS